MKFKYLYYVLCAFFSMSFVNAHILVGENGFSSGLTHPLFGFDHLLAMIAVGIIGVQIGKKAIYQLPLTFVSVMLLGGIYTILGFSLIGIEGTIAFSVIMLGLAIAFSKRLNLKLSMVFVGIFAFFHGAAHGLELPLMASPILYVIGFVLVTAILHISGIIIGYYSKKTQITQKLLHGLGILVSLCGIYFLIIA